MKYNFDLLVNRKNSNCIKWQHTSKSTDKDDVIPMWIADMDFETVPQIKEAIITRAQHNIYGYTNFSDEYYQAIINWYQKRHDWKIEKNWISHSTSVVNSLHIAVRALTSKNDGVVIQTPVYAPFYSAIKSYGCKTILNPLKIVNDRYVPDVDDLENKFKYNNVKLLLLCNPHNPVGRVFTREELVSVGNLCLKYSVIVVSDEIHSDLVFKQYKHIPFASISKEFEQNSIICTAPSKTFNLAGLCTSNIIIPNRELKEKYDNICENMALKSFNIFGAIACQAAYTYGEEWLNQLIDYIEANKNYVINFIKDKIPQLMIYDAEATYLLWIDCRKLGFDKSKLEKFMLSKAKLLLNQGYIFGTEGEGFVRMNIACPRATLEEAMKRLENAVNV